MLSVMSRKKKAIDDKVFRNGCTNFLVLNTRRWCVVASSVSLSDNDAQIGRLQCPPIQEPHAARRQYVGRQ